MTDPLFGNRIDRRKFLVGVGGALLAIPMLESLSPRRAFAGPTPAPKRLIVVVHEHGRVVGGYDGGTLTDWWSPGSSTMALPAPSSAPMAPGPSKMLAALAPITNEIVTIDGIDNIVRQAGNDRGPTLAADGHFHANLTCLNCVLPKADGSGGAASVDYVVGSRLTAGTSVQPSIIFDADSGVFDNGSDNFWGLNGTPSTLATGAGQWVDPADAIANVFAGYMGSTKPPTPTLQQRLQQNRGSVLDSVLSNFNSLRAKVNPADQARLDQHANFIRSLENHLSRRWQPTIAVLQSSQSNSAPNQNNAGSDGNADNVATPAMISAMVQSLACDITRCAGLAFNNADDPSFGWLFGGNSPFSSSNWHADIHTQQPSAIALQTGFQFYPQMFTLLVQSLANMQDLDGSRMLDNTLVVWVSPMGYGSSHQCFNIPVVLAGGKNLPGAFPKGQGRHVVCTGRNSLGDLWAQVLRMLGGSDMTFGATGTLQAYAGSTDPGPSCGQAFCGEYGYPGHIGPDTPSFRTDRPVIRAMPTVSSLRGFAVGSRLRALPSLQLFAAAVVLVSGCVGDIGDAGGSGGGGSANGSGNASAGAGADGGYNCNGGPQAAATDGRRITSYEYDNAISAIFNGLVTPSNN